MKCSQVNKKLSRFIRKEVDAEERITIRQHLQHCNDCRTDYHKYLNLFYTIDYHIVDPISEYEYSRGPAPPLKRIPAFHRRMIWLTAAAIIVIMTISTIMISRSIQRPNYVNEFRSSDMKTQIFKANQEVLSRIFAESDFIPEETDQAIQVDFLMQRLGKLKGDGITTLKIPDFSASQNTETIDLDLIIRKLAMYKKTRSVISFKEISDYLTMI